MKFLFESSVLQDRAEKEQYRWQVAISVLILFVIGSILNIPFSRELKRLNIEAGKDVFLNESWFADLTAVGFSSLILGAILVFIGLWITPSANLGAPVIARLFSKEPISKAVKWKDVWTSILIGSLVAVILLGFFELQKEFYPVAGKLDRPAKPFYAIVSFSAGITEEIMFRLGLMSLIIVIIQGIKKVETPTSGMVWTGMLISAVFFGLIHLPLSTNFVDINAFSITVTMVGNLITGTTFGWIFWKRGLLIAILSHVAFDLVFHVLGSPYS